MNRKDPVKPIITYATDDIWSIVSKELNSRLPLRSLVCQTRAGAASSTRILNALNVEFKRYSQDQFPRTGTGGFVLNSFFLHLFITSCDDVDEYKNLIRKQIVDWCSVVGAKKHQEWLIVHISNEKDTKAKTLFSSMTSGFAIPDRIKSDISNLNPSKKDRVLSLKLHGNESKDYECWNEFIAKIKEGILNSFNSQITQADEDTRRLDQQRLMPGWNYCQFFIMKESLAFTFELMNLYEESLLHYDELEAGFFQTLCEQALPWFRKFGATEVGDDSLDITDFLKKPFRDLIYQNSITIFDFRIYLFARQLYLLLRMGRCHQALERAQLFINSFSKTLDEYKISLIPSFKESWIFSACMSVVDSCDELVSKGPSLSLPIYKQYESSKAFLLHQARIQLDKLGILYERLSRPIHAFAREITPEEWMKSLQDQQLDHQTSLHKVFCTHPFLASGLENESKFDELYIKITSQAIAGYETSCRYKTAQLLKNDLALLHYSRSRFEEASSIWTDVCKTYLEQGYKNTCINLMERQAICFKILKNYSEYVLLCFQLIQEPDCIYLKTVQDYISDLNSYAHKMQTEQLINANGIFEIKILNLKNKLAQDDIMSCNIELTSFLSCELKVQQSRLILKGDDEKQVICRTFQCILKPGKNHLNMILDEFSHPGYFKPSSFHLYIGKLELLVELTMTKSPRLFISENISFLLLKLTCPKTIQYHSPLDHVDISISSKNTMLRDIGLSVAPIYGCEVVPSVSQETSPHFYIKECDISETCQVPLTISLNEKNTREIGLKLNVEYKTMDDKKHFYSAIENLYIASPLEISHKWIPNTTKDWNLVQISLANNVQEPLTIDSISLNYSPLNTIVEPLLAIEPQSLHLNQTTEFLFKIPKSWYLDVQLGLELSIEYHYLRQELENYLLQELTCLLESKSSIRYFGFLSIFLLQQVLPKISLTELDIWKRVPLYDYTSDLKELISKEDKESQVFLLEIMQEFYNSYSLLKWNDVDYTKSCILYSISIPKQQSILSVLLKMESDVLTVGESSPFKLVLQKHEWNAPLDSDLYYSIHLSKSWLMSGKSKHVFRMNENQEEFVLDFIPLKAGYFHLPFINVQFYNHSPLIVLQENGAQQVKVLANHSCKMFIKDE